MLGSHPSPPSPPLSTVCQPSMQSSSWSRLPVVEVPGCLRHPTSIATQLFTIINVWSNNYYNTSIGVDSGISLRTTIHRFTFGRTFSPESSTCRLGDSDTNTTKKDFQQTVFPVTVRIPDSHLWLKYNFNYLS